MGIEEGGNPKKSIKELDAWKQIGILVVFIISFICTFNKHFANDPSIRLVGSIYLAVLVFPVLSLIKETLKQWIKRGVLMKKAKVIKMDDNMEPLYKGDIGNVVEEKDDGVVLDFEDGNGGVFFKYNEVEFIEE